MATQQQRPYRFTFVAHGKKYQMPVRGKGLADAREKGIERMKAVFGEETNILWDGTELITYEQEWNCWLAWLDARFEDAAELVQADGSYKRIGGENIFVDINDDVFHLTRDLGSDVWELRPKHPTADELEMIGVAS